MGLGKQRLKLLRRTPLLKRFSASAQAARRSASVRAARRRGGTPSAISISFFEASGSLWPAPAVGLCWTGLDSGRLGSSQHLFGYVWIAPKRFDARLPGLAIGRIDEGRKRRGNNILRGQPGAKRAPCSFQENKRSLFSFGAAAYCFAPHPA